MTKKPSPWSNPPKLTEEDYQILHKATRATPQEPQPSTAALRPDDSAIKAHCLKHWRNEFWGSMDCDQCLNRQSRGAPCNACPRWPHFIKDHRKRVDEAHELSRVMSELEESND